MEEAHNTALNDKTSRIRMWFWLVPQAVDRDGVAVGFSGNRHLLAVGIGIDFVGIGDLINLAFFRHQHDLVVLPNTPRHASGVDPHGLSASGTLLIDDI